VDRCPLEGSCNEKRDGEGKKEEEKEEEKMTV